MKKLLIILIAFGLIACNPESLNDENKKSIDGDPDPVEVCPPNDRNCNGIPDDQE